MILDGPALSPEWRRQPRRVASSSAAGSSKTCNSSRRACRATAASAELNLEIVVGIMLQLMRALGEGRLSSLDRDAALGAILRAIGLSARQAKSVLARLSAPADGAMPDGPRPPKSQRRRCGEQRGLTLCRRLSGDDFRLSVRRDRVLCRDSRSTRSPGLR